MASSARNLESTRLGLTDEELGIVGRLLSIYVPDRPVWAFGSRAFGRARRRSDLDLAIGGPSPLAAAVRVELKDAFDESDLPIEVDVVDLNDVSQEFRKRIEPDFVSLATEALPAIEAEEEDGMPFDKLREECGVMAVYNHPDAARMTYWGLYSLQHRGQESAGIASADGQQVNDIKGMGLVSEIFTDDVLAKLPGHIAIGHTRYSTTGDSALLNAQPISVESTKGLIAIAHNGNLINLGTAKERFGARWRDLPDDVGLRDHYSADRALHEKHADRLHGRCADAGGWGVFDCDDDAQSDFCGA